MINQCILKIHLGIVMSYNETTVVIGGLMHIPIIIIVLRFIENRFNNRNWTFEELNYDKLS